MLFTRFFPKQHRFWQTPSLGGNGPPVPAAIFGIAQLLSMLLASAPRKRPKKEAGSSPSSGARGRGCPPPPPHDSL